ncbi:MAG: hypothetical protein H7Z10_03620, partial [Gemmatimonadaceae bacterium]|nr:hypothetical protein [Acetobacteraceae bacterium]
MPFVGTADAAYWTVAGFADATGDGQADILWRGAAGETYLWSLEGGTLLATPFVGMADAGDWTVAGFADATGDGQADILWRGAAGDTYLWTLDGGRVSSMPFVGSADAAAWTVAGFADATGDGKADILWRGADGQVFLWGLDDSTVNEMRFLGTGEPGAVIAAFADATGDGRADVLFQGQPGASPVWDVAPAAEPTSAAPFASLAEAPAGSTEAAGLVAVGAPVYAAGSRVLTVGADKQYRTVGAAVGASRDGDVLLVDAGRYVNDFAVVRTKIAILAVGGRVEMVATVPPPNWKGILTVQADCRIEGVDFSGARIPDEYGHNGAGIRLEGGALSLFNTAFRGNQNGILTNNTAGLSITIDQSLFDGNGGRDGGKGNIHNIYIGHIDAATVTNSVFQNALVGHEFKSRAAVNTLTNNLFVSGVGAGTGSYNVDLPDGGRAVLTGNTFVKGTGAENPNMVHFGGEGIPYAGSSLTMNDNRFVSSNGSAIGLLNHTSVTAVLSGTVLDGLAPESFLRGPARATGTTDAGGQAVADTTLVGVLPGQTTIFDDAADHSIVIDGTRIKAVQGGAGRLTVQADAGHIVVIGGSGGLDLTEAPGSGGSRYATAAGSRNRLAMLGVGQNLVDSQGTDLIIAGDGNQTAQLNGDATVVGGRGNSTWAVNGTASIDTGSGSATITLGSTARLSLTGVNDHYRLSTSGGTATFDTTNAGRRVAGSIVGGATDMQVYDGVMRIDTAAGGEGAVLRLDHGGAKVRSAGADEIHAGTGANTVIVSGRAKVFAGTGTLEVYSHGFTGAEVFGRGGTYVIDGDGGGMTYHGGDLASTVDLRLSRITLRGGAGHMTVNGGMSETIIGGAGGITVNERGGGGNAITTQAGSTNLLALSNAGRVTSHGRDTITSAGGNQVIDTYGDATVVLGAGNSQVGVYGRATVTAGAGSNRVTVGRGADASIEARDLTRVSA